MVYMYHCAYGRMYLQLFIITAMAITCLEKRMSTILEKCAFTVASHLPGQLPRIGSHP